VNRKGDLVGKVRAQSDALGYLDPLRGLIFAIDKNGNYAALVANKDYPTVYAVPIEIQDAKEAAALLSPIIGKDVDSLVVSFSKPESQYTLLIEKSTDQQVQEIKDLNLKGIYIKSQTFRSYPFGTMAAQVLGFISSGSDGQVSGRYGLELEFDDQLKGEAGSRSSGSIQDPINGKDLYLTIDRNIQNEAEQIITPLVKQWNAVGATMIVQEPSTGKILAMANYPTFDPNEYSKYPFQNFLNSSVQLPYEPGSVFKVITMATGIDAGKITPDTTYTDTGCVKLDSKWTICNWDNTTHGPYGKITMANVIEHSLNVGAVFAEKQIGNSVFTDYVKKFGFGTKSEMQLPGELAGNVNNLNNGRSSNYATASYGQGITTTPVQLITAFSAIANGGVLMKPLILADEKPQVVRRVISQDAAQKVTQMMVSAIDFNKIAAVSQYEVAGKTGTAFTTDYDVKGYNESKLINTFIGYAPASNPKFTVFIKLDRPQNAPLAGQTVVPQFRTMVEFLLNYYNIAPDRAEQ
jgi:cell division protein FtsI/penicillin-binding protein 2